MGKHSVEKKKSNKKVYIFLLLIIIIAILLAYFISKNKTKTENGIINSYTIQSKTVEGEKLVLKSNSDYCRYVEFIFSDDILDKVKVYKQFTEKDKYEESKQDYEALKSVKLVKYDDKNLILEVEKLDLGTDEGKTYEQIYDTYVVQIIGEYNVVI